MKLLHLLLFFGALFYAWAAYHIPLNRHKDNPKLPDEIFDKITKNGDSFPFRYGSIPLNNRTRDVLPIYNYLSTQYFGILDIGTPAQTFNICFDTGSSDFFVLAPNCTGLACWGRKTFNWTDSTSYEANGTSILLPFGSGNFSGFLGSDDMTVGDYAIKDMLFSLIDSPESESFLYARFDGLAGLAYPALAIQNLPVLFQTMLDQGLISEPSYSFFLTRDINQNGSALIFGGVDKKYANSSFHYVNLTHETYFMTDLDDLKLGNKSYITGKMNAIVDTGTSAIVGPYEIFEPIIDTFPDPIDCDEIDKFDNLVFNIGGVDFEVPPTTYIVQAFGHCSLGIIGAIFEEKLNNTVIIGDVFLREFYTHFDYGNARLGFAEAANVTDIPDLIDT